MFHIGIFGVSDGSATRSHRTFRGLFDLAGSARRSRLEDDRAARSSTGLWLRPTIAFEDAPRFDIICVPGGRGIDPLLLDDEVLDFLRAQALAAKFVTSVCTGALLLGAAACWWANGDDALDLRRSFACFWRYPHTRTRSFRRRPGHWRRRDAGIDFALALVGELAGAEAAMAIQLQFEYAPKPPFDAGDPSSAPPVVVERFASKAANRETSAKGW